MQNRIRELRQRASLSMQALADRAGTSAPQINKLEKGERRLTLDWMVRIGRALGVDPTELLPPGLSRGPTQPTESGSGSFQASPTRLGPADLPVLGQLAGGGGIAIPADHTPVEWTYRPAQLRGA